MTAVETTIRAAANLDDAPLNKVLARAMERGGADVHIKAYQPPKMVWNGTVVPVDDDAAPLSPDESKALMYGILKPEQIAEFERDLELDCSFEIRGVARFRVNVHWTNATVGAVIRIIPPDIRSVETLGLPPALKRLAFERQGLVLVTGPTGSGKTTTLASLLDYINVNKAGHIVTIEDPIEVSHPHKKCVMTQREVGGDTKNFAKGLRAALRQAPNVILIGEMRDQETIKAALEAAETGHLVFSTLHTNDSVQSINRVVNAFPPHEQEPIRIQLANTLKGCMAQRLIPRQDRPGRFPCLDLLIVTATAREAILKNKLDELYDIIRNGGFDGMISMNQSLVQLYANGVIDFDRALSYSENKNELMQLLRDHLRSHMPHA